MQELPSVMLGEDIHIVCEVNNTQAISAVKKGYSQKLRHLQRTHRVSIGASPGRYGIER